MRKTLVLTAGLLAGCVASSFAMQQIPVDRSDLTEWQALLQVDQTGAVSHNDTAFFGGNGTGSGAISRGGIWNFEANSGEAPQFFPDGDPVGNQFRDGWTFVDNTTRTGPSSYGSPHFNNLGVYNFNYDATPGTAAQGAIRPGGYAHRATTHPNNGINDGPGPLQGSWSLWIGTNMELNPENCHWLQTHGYGDAWCQGIHKSYAIPAGHLGDQINISFFHRYAVEAGFDTNWVEISFDGTFWDQVGDDAFLNGIYNGGDANGPLPLPAGAAGTVQLMPDGWPTNAAGTLHVRFRFAADAYFSDSGDGGDFRYCWQIDDIQTVLDPTGTPIPLDAVTTFEANYGGWQIASFEGFDFGITLDPLRPAGRIVQLTTIAEPPIVECPEACGLENRVFMVSDKDDCNMVDDFQHSYIQSRAFAIGGPTLPDLDGDAGRLVRFDAYTDGGAGNFETGLNICWAFWPFNAARCPFTPGAGHPGAGVTFNWSRESTASCDLFGQGTGTDCIDNVNVNISSALPADADSALLHIGAISQCRHFTTCDVNDNGTPFYDNIQFGVFNPAGVVVASRTLDRYSDNYPTADGSFLTQTARTDGAHDFSGQLGTENPIRFCRADTAACQTGGANRSVFLRWAVERGACQPNLNHAFFNAFPPSAPGSFPNTLTWHAARMDTGRSQGLGGNEPGNWMTCFHESDPRNNTFWTGQEPVPGWAPCDDILPDGLFTAGTNVYYFFEARNAATGAVMGSFPAARNGAAVKTTANYKDLWLQLNTLPKLASNCDGSVANNVLVISDYQSDGVPGRATGQRERLVSTLSSLGLQFDVYDVVGTNFGGSYNTIGRRDDLGSQVPRPPFNGATDLQLNNYECIWYQGGLLKSDVTLTDELTQSANGGHPSRDQQSLQTWIAGCSAGQNRLLVLEGIGWASDIDVNTVNGPSFLTNRGVDVLADDYAQDLAANDLRRCARIVGQGPGAGFDGEILGSGCPDNIDIDVITATTGPGAGEAVANYVESGEDGDDPVTCANDANRPLWHAVVRRATGTSNCQRSVSMSFSFSELYPLNCTDQCLFDDYIINGDNADLVIDLFTWAGCPINPSPIGVKDPEGAPRFANELYQAQPNPANPSAMIRYTIAQKGHVQLRIFDVSGRLVRTLVDKVQEPAETAYEQVWDGSNDQGQRVGSGVFFYQIDAPGFSSSKKLVILK